MAQAGPVHGDRFHPTGRYCTTPADRAVINRSREALSRSIELLRGTAIQAEEGESTWPKWRSPNA